MPNILIAGGGSGGHVAPAIAVAEALTHRNATVIIVHSERSIDKTLLEHSTFEGVSVPAVPLSKSPLGFIHFCKRFIQTKRSVRKLIKERNIDCTLTTGGFVSPPSLQAARSMECPTVLLNLDDPPGKANRLAVRWADRIISSVQSTLENAEIISAPLRKCVINESTSHSCIERLGLDPHRLTLLVTGASQGASTINELIPALAKQNPHSFRGWQVLHIAGKTKVEQVRKAWKEVDVPCQVVDFHHEMCDVWGAADLAITRGGANTIAEIAINAVPTIVMPYPFHKDVHQRTNAQPLATLGGVIVATDHIQLKDNLEHTGSVILTLLSDHKTRFTMRQQMVTAKPVNGSIAAAETCLSCVKGYLGE